jgi:hypothetical protein
MQTFLPYPDFAQSARVLDTKRLGKQRVEAYQLVRGQWHNHPASKMWRNYKDSLIRYMNTMITEWTSRGYKNTMIILPESGGPDPWWLGWEPFHYAHRCNLARKSEVYLKLWPDVDITIPYVWPAATSPTTE